MKFPIIIFLLFSLYSAVEGSTTEFHDDFIVRNKVHHKILAHIESIQSSPDQGNKTDSPTLIRVQNFGVKESNQDNSKYLQKAIDSAGRLSNAQIIFPAGDFKFAAPVRINNAPIIGVKGKTKFILVKNFKFNEKFALPRKSAFIYNESYGRTYIPTTANSIFIKNISFESLIEADSLKTSTILLLGNIKGGSIKNCTFFAKKNKSQLRNTVVDLYSCVKNLDISDCEISNLNEKDYGGGMWVRNQTSGGTDNNNATENITIRKVKFNQASSDEALSIFGSIGLTRNITVDSCIFNGLTTSTPHSVLLSILPLEGRGGGNFTRVSNIRISNSVFVDSSYRNYILRVGGNSKADRDNVCDSILISGNTFYSRSKNSDQRCSVIMNVPNIGVRIDVIGNRIFSDNAASYGIRGFQNVTDNKIASKRIGIGVFESSRVENNNIDVAKHGILKGKNLKNNKVRTSD